MSTIKELFEHGKWYHCFRHDGLVSNGTYDVEQHIKAYKFDENYNGKKVLDVGCSDGYFSIWMKEHGADYVRAIDSNKYDGSVAIEIADFDRDSYETKYQQYATEYDAFRLVYEQYGLKDSNKLLLMSALKKMEVDYHNGTVYDLKDHRNFDLVMCNNLLEHLRDPITAIEQLFSTLNSNGKCIITTILPSFKERLINRNRPTLTYVGHLSSGGYYIHSEASLFAMCKAAGFRSTEVVGRFYIRNRTHNSGLDLFVVHAYK